MPHQRTTARARRAAALARGMAVSALAVALGGCVMAAPSAFQLATYAADGASYATTGKSVTDHLISEVTAKDCAMKRILDGEDICKEREPARMPDGSIAPNAQDVALGVQPAGVDKEFQSFAISQADTGEGDNDEVFDAPMQSFTEPPAALSAPTSTPDPSGTALRVAANTVDAPLSAPIPEPARPHAAPSVPVDPEAPFPGAPLDTSAAAKTLDTPVQNFTEPPAPIGVPAPGDTALRVAADSADAPLSDSIPEPTRAHAAPSVPVYTDGTPLAPSTANPLEMTVQSFTEPPAPIGVANLNDSALRVASNTAAAKPHDMPPPLEQAGATETPAVDHISQETQTVAAAQPDASLAQNQPTPQAQASQQQGAQDPSPQTQQPPEQSDLAATQEEDLTQDLGQDLGNLVGDDEDEILDALDIQSIERARTSNVPAN